MKNQITSLLLFHSKLLSKTNIAGLTIKKITCPYFNCLSLFKLYKYEKKNLKVKTYSILIEKVNKLKLPFQKSDVL